MDDVVASYQITSRKADFKVLDDVIAAVHSGFAEILPDKVTLLAEIAEWPDEIDKGRAEAAMKRAEERLANKTEAIDVKRAEFALRKALVRLDIAK
jgi:F-type H+-transporting ATPase subunit epsilon